MNREFISKLNRLESIGKSLEQIIQSSEGLINII